MTHGAMRPSSMAKGIASSKPPPESSHEDRPLSFSHRHLLFVAINSPSQIAQADDRKADELIGSVCGK